MSSSKSEAKSDKGTVTDIKDLQTIRSSGAVDQGLAKPTEQSPGPTTRCPCEDSKQQTDRRSGLVSSRASRLSVADTHRGSRAGERSSGQEIQQIRKQSSQICDCVKQNTGDGNIDLTAVQPNKSETFLSVVGSKYSSKLDSPIPVRSVENATKDFASKPPVRDFGETPQDRLISPSDCGSQSSDEHRRDMQLKQLQQLLHENSSKFYTPVFESGSKEQRIRPSMNQGGSGRNTFLQNKELLPDDSEIFMSRRKSYHPSPDIGYPPKSKDPKNVECNCMKEKAKRGSTDPERNSRSVSRPFESDRKSYRDISESRHSRNEDAFQASPLADQLEEWCYKKYGPKLSKGRKVADNSRKTSRQSESPAMSKTLSQSQSKAQRQSPRMADRNMASIELSVEGSRDFGAQNAMVDRKYRFNRQDSETSIEGLRTYTPSVLTEASKFEFDNGRNGDLYDATSRELTTQGNRVWNKNRWSVQPDVQEASANEKESFSKILLRTDSALPVNDNAVQTLKPPPSPADPYWDPIDCKGEVCVGKKPRSYFYRQCMLSGACQQKPKKPKDVMMIRKSEKAPITDVVYDSSLKASVTKPGELPRYKTPSRL